MKTFDSMGPDRLDEIISRFSQVRVAVLGDYFLDKYIEVDPELAETSLETGKTAHQVVSVRHTPGAAGTIVCNLAALGAGRIEAIGFSGDDGEGFDLRHDLRQLGCDTTHLHCDAERMTPTYLKPRDRSDASLSGEHSRYDTKNRSATSAATQSKILESLETVLAGVDALIVLDQVEEADCGVVTSRVRNALAGCGKTHPNVILWADSRRFIREFSGVIIKPNQFEAVRWESPPTVAQVELKRLDEAIRQLQRGTDSPVFVTRGADGMAVLEKEEMTLVPSVRVDGPVDPTGAGDSATVGAVLSLAAGASLAEAALVGNLVASITIKQLATTGTASPDQVRRRLALWQSQRDA